MHIQAQMPLGRTTRRCGASTVSTENGSKRKGNKASKHEIDGMGVITSIVETQPNIKIVTEAWMLGGHFGPTDITLVFTPPRAQATSRN